MGKLLLPPYVVYKSVYPEMESTKLWYISNSTTRHYIPKDCNIDSYFQLHRCCILNRLYRSYRGADKSLARPGRKQAAATEDFEFHIPIYNHNWRNISTIYVYKTRLASNEIFSPSNKIHWEVDRARDLSAPRGADKSLTYQEGNKLQRQNILIFIYPIYNHHWRNISTIYIYKTRLASKEIF
jgi:hypothetical protein